MHLATLFTALIGFSLVSSQSKVSWDAVRESAEGKWWTDIQVLKDYLDENNPDAETTINGKTLLMRATMHDNPEGVRLLLDAGADVNAKDNPGSTALTIATWNGSTDSVKILLEDVNIDVNILDGSGDSALGLAENDEIKKMLQQIDAVCQCSSSWCRDNRSNC